MSASRIHRSALLRETHGPVLAVTGLTRIFGSGHTAVRAVDGVDLTVQPGEVVLIMGPSGSGKTTLLSLIGGLLKPTSGTICIAGVDISSASEPQLWTVRRHLVGFVFQGLNLLDSLSARENVEVALNLAGVSGTKARLESERLLRELGMEERMEFKPRHLSGGEKQRVSIARALANNPRLVLADEPTASLDSRRGREVAEILRGVVAGRERSVIIVSHDERITDIADRILWMEDGRVSAHPTV
jgi:putative ABC transport system ATP-binding protein